MKNVKIQDLEAKLVNGVDVQMPDEAPTYRERYFEWSASSLLAGFGSNKISGGILKASHHTPVFSEIETHVDNEMFYFISGVALMPFVDLKNGQPDMETVRIVRIQPGTQIIISAGKGHFVPVAEGPEPLHIVVVGPRMDAPRTKLPITIEGI